MTDIDFLSYRFSQDSSRIAMENDFAVEKNMELWYDECKFSTVVSVDLLTWHNLQLVCFHTLQLLDFLRLVVKRA